VRLVRLLVLLVSLVEVPLWLLRRRALFRNPVVYLFSTWSFGHTVSGLDFAARLHHPARISLVFVPHASSNPFLPDCFEESMDVFRVVSALHPKTAETDEPRLRVLAAWLRLLTRVRRDTTLTDLEMVYGTAPLAPGPLYGTDPDGTHRVESSNYTGYLRLLEEDAGVPPRLPERLRERCTQAIETVHPGFLERPFATLLLREKGARFAFDTASRTVGEQRNYRAAVELLARRGYRVVGAGETDRDVFADSTDFHDLSGVELPPGLLNLFLLTECALFVGQQSGPFVLPDSRRIPCVLCDAFPYRLGTFRPDDLVLFKPLLTSEGVRLTLAEIYREQPQLAYGYGFTEARVSIGASPPEEIVEAVDETLDRLEGSLALTADDQALCRAFSALVPPEMPLHWHRNRPPLALLRRERSSLL